MSKTQEMQAPATVAPQFRTRYNIFGMMTNVEILNGPEFNRSADGTWLKVVNDGHMQVVALLHVWFDCAGALCYQTLNGATTRVTV